jgi:O-antigen/teichoic acid export membrane protein
MINIYRPIVEANKPQFILMSGTFISQILSFASVITLARHLNQTSYGHYSFALIVITTLLPITTRKLETLVVNASEFEIKIMLGELIRRSTYFGVLYSCSLAFISYYFWNFSVVMGLLFALSVFVVNGIMSISVISISFCLRSRNFRAIALNGLLQNGFTLIFQIIILKLENSISTLMFAFFVGRLLAFGGFFFWSDFRTITNNIVSLKEVKTGKQKNSKNHIFYSSILDQLSLYSPILYCFAVNNQKLLGLSSLALSLALAPSTLIISGFSMQFISHKHDQDEKRIEKIRYNLFSLVGLCVIYLVIMVVFAEKFSNEVFAEEWSGLTNLIIMFSIPITFLIFITPFQNLLISYEKSITVLKSNVFGLVGVLTVCMIGLGRVSDETIIGFLLFGKVLGQLLSLSICKAFSRKQNV